MIHEFDYYVLSFTVDCINRKFETHPETEVVASSPHFTVMIKLRNFHDCYENLFSLNRQENIIY